VASSVGRQKLDAQWDRLCLHIGEMLDATPQWKFDAVFTVLCVISGVAMLGMMVGVACLVLGWPKVWGAALAGGIFAILCVAVLVGDKVRDAWRQNQSKRENH